MFFENSNHQNSSYQHHNCLASKSSSNSIITFNNNNNNDNSISKKFVTTTNTSANNHLIKETTNQQLIKKDDYSLTLSLKAYKYCHGDVNDNNSLTVKNQPMTTDYYTNNLSLVPKPAPRNFYRSHKNQQFSNVECASLVVKPIILETNKTTTINNDYRNNDFYQRKQQYILSLSNESSSLKSMIHYNSSSKYSDYRTKYLMNCLPNQSLIATTKTTTKLLSGSSNINQSSNQSIRQTNLPTAQTTSYDGALSSNNDISSTDDDTEDSTDNKHDKPKVSKLQFVINLFQLEAKVLIIVFLTNK